MLELVFETGVVPEVDRPSACLRVSICVFRILDSVSRARISWARSWRSFGSSWFAGAEAVPVVPVLGLLEEGRWLVWREVEVRNEREFEVDVLLGQGRGCRL